MATKAELIDAVATRRVCRRPMPSARSVRSSTTSSTATKKGDKVAWPGFGSFSTTKRAARTGRNPQTGAPVKIAASTAMKFTPSATLKAALNPRRKK